MRIASPAHAVFAASLIGLGILSLITGDLGAIWQPIPKTVPAREALAYLCALVSLLCGIGLLWPRAATAAARMLLAYLLLWTLLFRLPDLLRAPAAIGPWEGCAETAVIIAAAWVLYAQLASGWDRQHLRFASGQPGTRLAQRLYGLAMIVFGLAHFGYLKQTAALVPAWLPAHTAWAAFTGGAYIAAGLALLTGIAARPAAILSAVQMGLFTLLVWLPILAAAGPKTAFQWNETLISCALTISGWLVAESCRSLRQRESAQPA